MDYLVEVDMEAMVDIQVLKKVENVMEFLVQKKHLN
jgi:hypothetical protein